MNQFHKSYFSRETNPNHPQIRCFNRHNIRNKNSQSRRNKGSTKSFLGYTNVESVLIGSSISTYYQADTLNVQKEGLPPLTYSWKLD